MRYKCPVLKGRDEMSWSRHGGRLSETARALTIKSDSSWVASWSGLPSVMRLEGHTGARVLLHSMDGENRREK